MRAYDKPAIDTAAQIRLLEARGLKLDDERRADLLLSQVGYYRFSTYCFPFQATREIFLPGVRFETIERLYRLDEALRNRVFAAISPVEIFLRVRIVEGLGRRWGAFAHYLPELFRSDFNRLEWAMGVEAEISRAREPFIEHYRCTYSGFPKLPVWMGVEVMSLGTLSQLYNGLLPEPRRMIAHGLAVPHPVLRSWLHFLSYIRNVCAHHVRLWDRELAIRPDIPRKIPAWQVPAISGTHAFSIVPILEAFYRWAHLPEEALDSIRRVFVEISELDPRFMRMCGAPADWHGAPVLPDEERK